MYACRCSGNKFAINIHTMSTTIAQTLPVMHERGRDPLHFEQPNTSFAIFFSTPLSDLLAAAAAGEAAGFLKVQRKEPVFAAPFADPAPGSPAAMRRARSTKETADFFVPAVVACTGSSRNASSLVALSSKPPRAAPEAEPTATSEPAVAARPVLDPYMLPGGSNELAVGTSLVSKPYMLPGGGSARLAPEP